MSLHAVNAVYFTGYEFLKGHWTDVLNPVPVHAQMTSVVSSFANDGTPLPQLHGDKIESVPLPSYAYPVCGAIRCDGDAMQQLRGAGMRGRAEGAAQWP